MEETLSKITAAEPNGIVCFKGTLKHNSKAFLKQKVILNLTASTTRSSHTKKILISNVREAIYFGVDAVAVHLNISSKFESEMLEIIGKVTRNCEKFGMPIMAIIYPRYEENGFDNNYYSLRKNNLDEYTQLVAHCARIAVDLGVDIIKTQFTGTVKSFAEVVKCSNGVPVIIAGGPVISKNNALKMAKDAMKAGASGVCFGRNTYNRTDISSFIHDLKEIVHK